MLNDRQGLFMCLRLFFHGQTAGLKDLYEAIM